MKIVLLKANLCCGLILSLVQIYFLLFLGIVMYDNEFETKENKIWTKVKIEPQHMHDYERVVIRSNFCRRGQYLDFFFHVLCRNN